jgi:hypothetical protein
LKQELDNLRLRVVQLESTTRGIKRDVDALGWIDQPDAEVQSRRDIELHGLRVVNDQLLVENAKLRGDIEHLHRETSRLRGLKLTAEDALANDQHVIEALRKELRRMTAETMAKVNADRLVTEAPVLTDPWEGLTNPWGVPDRQPRSHGKPVRG